MDFRNPYLCSNFFYFNNNNNTNIIYVYIYYFRLPWTSETLICAAIFFILIIIIIQILYMYTSIILGCHGLQKPLFVQQFYFNFNNNNNNIIFVFYYFRLPWTSETLNCAAGSLKIYKKCRLVSDALLYLFSSFN